MKRGTVNESSVLSALRGKRFVKAVFECGMLSNKDMDWWACSPDGISLIDPLAIGFDVEEAASCAETYENLSIASVEIKTSVAHDAVDRALALKTMDVQTLKLGESILLKYIPKNHIGQVLQRMIVLNVDYCVYFFASEHAVLYIVAIHVSVTQRNQLRSTLQGIAGSVNFWAYCEDQRLPSFADSAAKKQIKVRLKFWNLINNYIKGNHPFQPLKLLKHGAQSFYSKIKGGVDGSAQARDVLCSSTFSFK